jgi:hypothetical protein
MSLLLLDLLELDRLVANKDTLAVSWLSRMPRKVISLPFHGMVLVFAIA